METPTRSTRTLFWQLQIGGWLLAVPLFAALVLIVFNQPAAALGNAILRQVIGFGLTLGLWRIYRRWPAGQFKFTDHVWKIGLGCCLATALDMLLTEIGQHALGILPLPELLSRGSFLLRLVLYLVWSAFYFVIRQEIESHATELRLARAEAANRAAELQLLRAQVNPHFLLNALNTIIGEAEHNPAGVIETTHAVADYLRYSLGHGSHLAPLGAELDAMGHYLHIERAHFGPRRFEWRIDATPEARAAATPTALVQPLVENAIKYGLRTSPAPLRLRVDARVADGMLVVTVENSGLWLDRRPGEEQRDSTGIGLNNLRRRLELLCGQDARLEIVKGDGTVGVVLRLPWLRASGAAGHPR